ncbi:MAG: helicase [Prevotella nigrescens]|uniref:Helicase n=1 Tax=Prevotella nigrescens TaxID=28133 RepID=A0A9D5WY94_9BACT|nr:helicase-related protein [Prevotella nigrescens]MBF1446949.1 helicase [Prevotella nigrescens]
MIRNKRDSLETFIREQLIGPGGCGNNFGIYPSYKGEEEPVCEVLSTTPGSIYSTAILFPRKDMQSLNPDETSSVDSTDEDNISDENQSSEDTDEQGDDMRDFGNCEDDEDINSLSRRFPDRIGVSCCVKDVLSLASSTMITISGRYYRKLSEKTRLYVNVEDVNFFEKTFSMDKSKELFSPYFVFKDAKLSLSRTINARDLKDFRDKMRDLNKYFCALVAKKSNGEYDSTYSSQSFQDRNKFLSAYKERLFHALKRVDKDSEYISSDKVNEYKERIARVEEYETFLSYFEDIISICDSRGFGFWVGTNFNKDIDLSTLDFSVEKSKRKLIIQPKEGLTKHVVKYTLSSGVEAALSVWLQIYKGSNGKTYLKVMLVNDSTKVKLDAQHYYSIVAEKVNELTFFGVKIDIASKNIIPYRNDISSDFEDQEANHLLYLYRNIKDYGIGHLCSVNWYKDDNSVMHVCSEFMPSVETPDVEPEPRDKTKQVYDENNKIYLPKKYVEDNQYLQFKWLSVLSTNSDETIVSGLLEFAESYHKWIMQLNAEGNKIGIGNIEKCQKDYERIKNNINEFLIDPKKMQIFRLMNTAMFMQLWHSKSNNQEQIRNDKEELTFEYYKNKALDTTIFKGVIAAWRPFQLAFILLNLDGVFQSEKDPKWENRNELVDLVWFPTGGGKTESYLGIIALVAINRRISLQGGIGNGVAAIMRYTLRLLTTQQFQRALRLILAMEQIRKWNKFNLGDKEFSIGLFVGENSLPNHYKNLAEEIRKNWTDDGRHGQIPLDCCPWCGSLLRATEVSTDHFSFGCSNKKCTYGKRNYLPVRLCDDHVYDEPPTLLFGTVDKFVQLSRRVNTRDVSADSRRLFGRGTGCNPPDLIIQDELHLLLGPLGSAVSLFEAAIDQLCSYKRQDGVIVRPKIISSTATTRNTYLQVRALYDRDVSIFPKNGTDYDDSFFAFYKREKKKEKDEWSFVSKRKYIGIMPTGRTKMTTQMRLAAILFIHRALYELKNIELLNANDKSFIKAADYYYSTISYFNSLKEVGKTDAQFYLEFTKYTRRLFKRVLRFSNMLECFYAYNEVFSKIELTGRLSGGEAVEELSKAQSVKWDPKKRLPYLKEGNKYNNAILPADYILATNMISVGLDVSRFNTIIMNSMPRNIAEYIQASSRVARDKAGLVLTLHNPFRSRDVSHFEKFREFHEKLYYYVEPISITPFSPKAIEKYLPLYMLTLIRHMHNELADRKDAKRMTSAIAADIKQELKRYFKIRYDRTKNLEVSEHALEREILTEEQLKYIYQWIDESLDQWIAMEVESGDSLVYYAAGRNASEETSLLVSTDAYAEQKLASKWVVPSALRLVEPESVLHILNK